MERDELIEAAAELDVLGTNLGKVPERHALIPRKDLIISMARMLDAPRLMPVLLGEHGVGKGSAVRALAMAMAKRNAELTPHRLHGRSIIMVTTSDLVCGALYANQLEYKLSVVAKNCKKHEAILHFCEPLGLIGAGATTHDIEGDVATLLTPYLRHGDLRAIATATPEAWMLACKRKPAFTSLFTPLIVLEPDAQETFEILKAKNQDWVARFKVFVPDPTRHEAMALAERLYPARRRPGKVVDLLEVSLAEFASRSRAARGPVKLPRKGPPPVPVSLTPDQLCEALRVATGLPRFLVVPSEPATADELLRCLQSNVMGQEHVLRELVQRVQMIKSRMCAPGRPLAAFLFAGPTGVGKTLVARSLAKLLLGSEARLIRFDMSEYQELDSVERFLGENRAFRPALGLVDAALADPMPVILLDEIEKAHDRVFDALLQVLGEGRLTDMRGRTAMFTNAIIVMTSNLGSDRTFVELPGQQECQASWERRVHEAVNRRFRPEFVNRLTATLTFSPLTEEQATAVARRELALLLQRQGISARRLCVELTDEAMRALLRSGYSERFGARPMQRSVDSLVGECVSQLIAEHPDVQDRTLRLNWISELGRMCIVPSEERKTGS